MEILICQQTQSDVTGEPSNGYSITFVNRNKKKAINEQDFFVDNSDIAQKVIQLKRLLKIYFDAQV